MAAIPMTLNGVLYDLYGRTTQRVVLIGEASYTGLGVGGGPMPPQAPVDPGYSPPWAQVPGVPTHPIVLPPSQPGVPTFPIWGPPGGSFPGGPGYPPVAGHPIPPIPSTPPDNPSE